MQHFLESEYPQEAPDKALFHVIPVPMECSVSYGSGTAGGPAAILEASQQLEAWDGISAPGKFGIHTQESVDCSGDALSILETVAERVGFALDSGAVPIVLGGEHTVSYGALKAVAKHFESPVGIIHIDAHADLRDSYEGSRFSHACVLRRIHEDFSLPLIQFATRDYSQEELEYRKSSGILWKDASELAKEGLPSNLPDDFPRNIYVTFDVDGLDSSLMPATGTPSPGGLFWWEAIHLLENCLRDRTVIGFDVVELSPVAGMHHADFTAAKLVHTLMGMTLRSRK